MGRGCPPSACSQNFDGPMPNPKLSSNLRLRVPLEQREPAVPGPCSAPSRARCKLAKQHPACWDAARSLLPHVSALPQGLALWPRVSEVEPEPRLLLRARIQYLA